MPLTGKKIHFMGVGGIGVSALAGMAAQAGAAVSGCDRADSPALRRLAAQGLPVTAGHDAAHAAGADILVYSSAVPPDHPERKAAGGRQEMRGRFLARFLDAAETAGIAGTHGKTTTTWLLAQILIGAGLDPSVYLGGLVPDLPAGNYRIGTGPFAAELDESDGSFLLPRLRLAVITNIESDHLSHYTNEDALLDAFRQFARGVEAGGVLIAGTDSPGAAAVCAGHAGRSVTFGLSSKADLTAENCAREAGKTAFDAVLRGRRLGRFSIALPGMHNVQNALAALAAALELGADAEAARRALAGAGGVGRRMELLGTLGGAAVYSDYAHHPTEVAAAIDGVRQNHAGRVLAVFQPHLYTRTRDYMNEFGAALAAADAVLLTDIYPAREEPLPGVTSEALADAVRQNGRTPDGPVPAAAAPEAVRQAAAGFEAVLVMGAGDIDAAVRSLFPAETEG